MESFNATTNFVSQLALLNSKKMKILPLSLMLPAVLICIAPFDKLEFYQDRIINALSCAMFVAFTLHKTYQKAVFWIFLVFTFLLIGSNYFFDSHLYQGFVGGTFLFTVLLQIGIKWNNIYFIVSMYVLIIVLSAIFRRFIPISLVNKILVTAFEASIILSLSFKGTNTYQKLPVEIIPMCVLGSTLINLLMNHHKRKKRKQIEEESDL